VRLPSGEVKPWTMNRTTQRKCAETWGDETRAWVGKKIKIQLREQNIRGLMKTVIYGIPIKEKLPATDVDCKGAIIQSLEPGRAYTIEDTKAAGVKYSAADIEQAWSELERDGKAYRLPTKPTKWFLEG
jgi:hypothetical protein